MLSPYDLIRMARARSATTGQAVRGYTIRRGSMLRFVADGGCVALDGVRCSLHEGRPLACRLYPLGLERTDSGEQLIRLDPEPLSRGRYGEDSSAGEFLERQGTGPYFRAIESYYSLIPTFRRLIEEAVDFERVEPREFWRRAVVEALLESNYDPNPLVDAIFDPDGLGCARETVEETVDAHVAKLAQLATRESDAGRLATAAVMLAVSLGYSPREITAGYG